MRRRIGFFVIMLACVVALAAGASARGRTTHAEQGPIDNPENVIEVSNEPPPPGDLSYFNGMYW